MNAPITSFRDPEPLWLSAAQLSEAVEGIQALIDALPRGEPVAVIADDIRTTTYAWKLECLISWLEEHTDSRSDEPSDQADCHMLEELRSALASTDRFIGRMAKRQAEEEARIWALAGVAGVERVGA